MDSVSVLFAKRADKVRAGRVFLADKKQLAHGIAVAAGGVAARLVCKRDGKRTSFFRCNDAAEMVQA